jgi:hypothetical protein
MVEKIGWQRYAEIADVRVIHTDALHSNFPAIPVSELVSESDRLVTSFRPGIEQAELLEANALKDFEDRPIRMVRLTDPSTGRQYVLRTRHDVSRCYQAIAESFNMSEKAYRSSMYRRQGDVLLRPLGRMTGKQFHS